MILVGIYKITNMLNGKIYIGSSSNIHKRWKAHKCQKKAMYPIQHAMNKYGIENFKFEIVELANGDIKHLISLEQRWLDYYKSYDPKIGYNVRTIAENNTGIKFSKSHNERLSKAISGTNHWAYGKKFTKEESLKLKLGLSKRVYKLVSPENICFATKFLVDFCKVRNLDYRNMLRVYNGEILSYKGWFVINHKPFKTCKLCANFIYKSSELCGHCSRKNRKS